MDVNKIFGFFSDESNNDSLEDYVKDKYKDHPLYWVSMACKLYTNHKTFNKQIVNLFDRINPQLDADDVKRAGDYMMNARCFDYLAKLDLTNPEHTQALQDYCNFREKGNLVKTINELISFYEEYEEYEACAVLKKISDFLRTS
jgi:hypothetical protein